MKDGTYIIIKERYNYVNRIIKILLKYDCVFREKTTVFWRGRRHICLEVGGFDDKYNV